MVMTTSRVRAAVVIAVGAVALAACGGSSGGGGGSNAGATPTKGGTIYYLTNAEQFDSVDPQRMYTGEDIALFGGTLYRTLTSFKLTPDPLEGTTIVPDLATDLGTESNAGKTWTFTIRDGATFQDGSAIACKDIAYGVSRTFATDIIIGGPTYAITMLDIPDDPAGGSAYKGPYAKTGQELFDKAVTCSADGKTITFNLKFAVPDFNYTVTLPAFSPVPKAADTGEKYGDAPISSGPYILASNKNGKGGKMILSRNDKWTAASDNYRAALPDTWEIDYGIDPKVIDQRVIQSSGNDSTAIAIALEPESLPTVFVSPTEAQPQYASRAVSALDAFVTYLAINVSKVPDLKVRQALAAALDRQALRKNAGGDYAGDYADGVISPNIGVDYAPTGLWDTLLGAPIPATGDPEYAKKLIAETGKPAPTITYDYPQSPTGDKAAAIVAASLGKAGFTVKLNPIEPGQFGGIIFNPDKAHELFPSGWASDWPNASTVIPELFTPAGGFNLSEYDNPEFTAKSDAAKVELDRAKQATLWQELNKQAMANVVAIPKAYTRSQRMTGTKVGGVYLWTGWGTWPYAQMGVLP